MTYALRQAILKALVRHAETTPCTSSQARRVPQSVYLSSDEIASRIYAPIGLVEDALEELEKRGEVTEVIPNYWDLALTTDFSALVPDEHAVPEDPNELDAHEGIEHMRMRDKEWP